MSATPTLLWFRQDLRLHDQPALAAAAGEGPVIPVYILDDDAPGDWAIGAAQRWWLHQSLAGLAAALEAKGSRLVLRRGDAVSQLRMLLDRTGAARIHAIRHAEPWWVAAETELSDCLCLHDGNHLAPLGSVTSGAGSPYKIYSAFWKALGDRMPPGDPLAVPHRLRAPEAWPEGDRLDDWTLLPADPDWASGFGDDWVPGEAEALRRLRHFAERAERYADERDLPGVEATSRLSPHLHLGEISPRTVWHAVSRHDAGMKFRKELAWRDFAAGVVLALPDYAVANGRGRFDAMPWRDFGSSVARDDFEAWKRGRTGYPIVDAGMRQLWATGWMHNRVRMIAASFLVKHLLIDWRAGERWFWDTLVDADYGNNSVNWQWVAGTGIDSNMWGRIMAPLGQSERFDAGAYIRRWVPELRDVPDHAIHDPDAAGCRPASYPAKIVAHREGRERALAAAAGLG